MDNIKKAILKASEHKRDRKDVQRILKDIDHFALKIRRMLLKKTYVASPYKKRKIIDSSSGKERVIYKPRFFPDQCIHWSLMLQLTPIIMEGMYYHNCGSIPKRGGSHAEKYIKRWMKNDKKNTKYILKIDVSQFYPSVDTELLKAKFRRKIKDPNALWLIDEIIDSHEDGGLPIGNYTSQWFGNYLLAELDHLIKEKFHVKYYVRYLDDMVMFGANKKVLHKIRKFIVRWLKTQGLKMKKNWQVFRTNDRGLDFVGIRFFYNKITLRRRISKRIRRRIKKIYKKFLARGNITFTDASAIVSYFGWIKKTNSYKYYQRYIKPYVNLKYIKEVIKHESKKRYKATKCYC